MPISSTTRKVGPLPGNGTATDFSFPFKVFGAEDIKALRTSPNGGIVTLAQPTQYLVILNEDQDEDPGGTIRLAEPLASGYSLTIVSAVPYTQPVDWQNQGRFSPEALNDGLDRATIQVQQVRDDIGRVLRAPDTVGEIEVSTPTPGFLLGWNATGDQIVNIDPNDLAGYAAFGSSVADTFTGDGLETVFTLTNPSGGLGNVFVAVGGVVQTPGADYQWLNSTQIEFTEPPPDGVTVLVRYQATLAEIPDVSNKADRTLSNLTNRQTSRFNLNQFWVTPEDFGAVGDGVADDTAAIAAMVASPLGKNVRWGDGKTYVTKATINVTAEDVTWEGSATIKLVRDVPGALFVIPILNVTATADRFYCATTMTFDHNAADMPAASYANQPAVAWACAVVLQATGFVFGCRVRNAWDTGVGIIRGTLTGLGTSGSPFSFSQVPGFPQSWTITTVDGEACGIGDHTGIGFGEVGFKGCVVNVLTGSDGLVQSVTGRANYGGFIADFGGGGEVVIGSLAFTGTLRDADNPSNGSGIDCYIGTGPVVIGALKSDNAGRYGLAITATAGPVSINARIHAAAEEGCYIRGGQVSGVMSLSSCSMSSAGTYPSLTVTAAEATPTLNLLIDATGPYHKHVYFSEASGSFTVQGSVEVTGSGAVSGLLAPGGPGGQEVARVANKGSYSLNRPAPDRLTTTDLFIPGDISWFNHNRSLMWNLFYDIVDDGWKFADNGWGGVFKMEADGTFSLYGSSGINASGSGAGAVVSRIWHFQRTLVDGKTFRARVPTGTGTVGDTNFQGGLEAIAEGTQKRVSAAYDNTNDRGVIQAVDPDVTVKTLALNPAGGPVQCGTGAWDTGPMRLGNYRLWVDGSGRLRIKNGAPTSDGDGTVVGTQT